MNAKRWLVVAMAALVVVLAGFGWARYGRPELPQRSVKELPAGYVEPSDSFKRDYAAFLIKDKERNEMAKELSVRIPKDYEFDTVMLAFKLKAAAIPVPAPTVTAAPVAATPAPKTAEKK